MSPGHNRHSLRPSGYDYPQPGAYFAATFTRDRECLFGEIVREEWLRTFVIRPNTQSSEFVAMPNHFHAVLVIADPGRRVRANRRFALTTNDGSSPQAPMPGSVGAVTMQFRSITARRIDALRRTEGATGWHRNYHNHLIRREGERNAVRAYMRQNPLKWSQDSNPPLSGASPICTL